MSEITDLAKTIKEENEKTRALNEKLANGTRENGQFASKEEIDVAKASLKKQDDQRAMTKKMLGISERRMAKAEDLSNQIQAQEKIMAEQKSALEESGIDADKSAKYQKEQIKLDKLNAQKDNATGAAASEDAAKAAAKDSKMMTYMKNTAGFLGGIAKQGMQKVKSGLKGFAKFAFGALAIAALAFLNSPQFDKYYDKIVKVIIPALTKLYEKVLKPLAKVIGGKLLNAFEGLLDVIDGEKGIIEFIGENKAVVATIALALGGKGIFNVLAKGVGLLGTGIKAAWGSAAVKTFLAGTGGKLLGVGLLVAGLAKATKDGFDGYAKSKEWGVDKFSATFGAALAGTKKGFKGATEQATKWAAILGGAGLLVFPPLGAVIGGALGLVIGGILGYFGGEEVAKGTQKLVDKFKVGWGQLILRMSDSLASYGDAIAKFFGFDIDEEEATKREKRRDLRMLPGKIKAEETMLNIQKIKQRSLLKDVADDDSNFFTKETKREQEIDRLKLSALTKQIAAKEAELRKMRSANIVNAPTSGDDDGDFTGTNIVNAPTSVVNHQSKMGIVGAQVSLTNTSPAALMAYNLN